MRPECALEGTCTINPRRVPRSREPGELRLMRAPAERGKATVIPARRPRPANSSSPRTETWRGLPLHLDVGTQLTPVMRTEVTCRLALEVFEVFVVGVAGVARVVVTGARAVGAPVPPGETTPPALAAAASPAPGANGSRQKSATAAVAATAKLPRVRASVVANKVRSLCADARGV